MDKQLWEILVPKRSNTGVEYSVAYHNEWDNKVREIAGGLTILKKSKGYWTDSKGRIFVEEMIPVRMRCDEKSIDKIIDVTLTHYDQKSVMAYLVSERVKLVYRREQVR